MKALGAVLAAGVALAMTSALEGAAGPLTPKPDRASLRRLLPASPRDPTTAVAALGRKWGVEVEVIAPATDAPAEGQKYSGDQLAGLRYAVRVLRGEGIEVKVARFLDGVARTPGFYVSNYTVEGAGGRRVTWTATVHLVYLPEPASPETLARLAGITSTQPNPSQYLRWLAIMRVETPMALVRWSGPGNPSLSAYVVGRTGALALRSRAAAFGLVSNGQSRPSGDNGCRLEFLESGGPIDFTPVPRQYDGEDNRWSALPALFDVATMCGPPPSAAEVTPIPMPAWRDGSGPLRLRLRDVDVVDVLRILFTLDSSQGFVEDEDVVGRVSLDWNGVSSEDVLGGLAAAGFKISPPAPLRRVSRSRDADPPFATGTGHQVSIDFKNGSLDEVLRLFADISGLRVFVPPGLRRRVSIQLADRPWDECFGAILAAAGLVYDLEKDRLRIAEQSEAALSRARGAMASVALGQEEVYVRSRLPLRAMTVRDLELAGLVHKDGRWTAYVHDPARTLFAVDAGQALLDAKAVSVDEDGLSVDWQGHPVRIPLLSAVPEAPITVSRETTYLTEPRRADGSVAYFAGLNLRFARGVTPENNAASILVDALGLGVAEPARRRMGLPASGPGSPSLIPSAAWAGETGDRSAKLVAERTAALATPWREPDHPLLAAWIRANEGVIPLLHAAARRPRHWVPLEPEDESFEVPSLGRYREAAHLLAAHAMLRLGSGDRAAAWEDVMALERLAALVSQGPFVIERLIGVALRGIANEAVAPLLAGTTDLADARLRSEALLALPPLEPPLAAEGERVVHLASWEARARLMTVRGPFAWEDALGPLDTPPAAEARATPLDAGSPPLRLEDLSGLPAEAVDWDTLMRTANQLFDAAYAPGDEADAGAAAARLRGLRERIASERPDSATLERLRRDPEKHPDDRAALGRRLALAGESKLSRAQVSASEAEAQLRLAQIMLAARVQRAERGGSARRLEDVDAPGFDPARPRFGYAFAMHPRDDGGFAVVAVPQVAKTTGERSFCLDDSGRATVSPDGQSAVVAEGRCGP